MFKSLSPFGKKKKTRSRPFKEFYTEWIDTLKNTHLPLLRHHMSLTTNTSPNLLSAHVEIMHHHFHSYYQTLDTAASNDVAQVLYPNWRNSLETPFLWLGDLHPYLFTNLLRSFIIQNDVESEQDQEDHQNDDVEDYNQTEISGGESEIEVGESCEFLKKQWPLMIAWKTPSTNLTAQIDQIERGLRLMVPALSKRAREAQADFVNRVGSEWERGNHELTVAEAAVAEMEEMVAIVMDANRLRKDVISEIVSITSVHQSALFLEGLAQFLVGFRDGKLVREFKKCKVPVN